jgi:hypothetical protein
MIGKLSLAAGLVACGVLVMPAAASAAALPQSRPAVDVDSAVVLQVHHRHHRHFRHHRGGFIVIGVGASHCSIWRHRCAHRWGWHTRAYYRCLWRHGC